VLVTDGADAFEVSRRRDHHAADALHRFGDERADRLGPFAFDDAFQFVGARDPALRIFEPQLAAVAERSRHPNDAGEQRLVVLVKVGQAGQTGGARRRAVVGAIESDDLELVRTLPQPPVEAHEADDRLVGLGAATGEHNARQSLWCHAGDACRELLGWGGREAEERRGVRQLARLCGNGARDLGTAVTDVDVPQRRQAVEVLAALRVPYVGAFAAYQQRRPVLLDGCRRREPADQVAAVALRRPASPRRS